MSSLANKHELLQVQGLKLYESADFEFGELGHVQLAAR